MTNYFTISGSTFSEIIRKGVHPVTGIFLNALFLASILLTAGPFALNIADSAYLTQTQSIYSIGTGLFLFLFFHYLVKKIDSYLIIKANSDYFSENSFSRKYGEDGKFTKNFDEYGRYLLNPKTIKSFERVASSGILISEIRRVTFLKNVHTSLKLKK